MSEKTAVRNLPNGVASSERTSSGGSTRGSGSSGSGSTRVKARPADRIFKGLSTASAASIMVILAGVAIFLIVQAVPAISADWQNNPDLNSGPTGGYGNFWSYVGPLIWGTIWASFLALIMGAPVAIGIALFISHYAPRRVAGVLGYMVDLLAAVPSIVFGLWGIIVIRPFLLPLSDWLNTYLGWIPIFGGQVSTTGSTIFAGAIVLAVMILPIITSISREIFLQTPRLHEEAALALGATKWEMIRLAVFPYARSGVVSATLLGLGRALGETMAIALIISPAILVSVRMLTEGENSQTIAANIALNFPIATTLQREALIATGLLLFVISLAVNMIARWITARSAPGTMSKKKKRQMTQLPPSDSATVLATDAATSPVTLRDADAASKDEVIGDANEVDIERDRNPEGRDQ